MTTQITLAVFSETTGFLPSGTLTMDSAGDLFGTAGVGAPSGFGSVYEIVKTPEGYANAPIVLASFSSVDGTVPQGQLYMDAAGDLFGTTLSLSAAGPNEIFEIPKTATGYAATPVILAITSGNIVLNPSLGLISDSSGDLFGVSGGGGPTGQGSVFELVKTSAGYKSTPLTLAVFNNSDGDLPTGRLVADTTGDLFGVTETGGQYAYGTIFEVAKTATGYSTTPLSLTSFDITDGQYPSGPLIMDASGDLFGTAGGGSTNQGVVFELVKTAAGYSSTPIDIATFVYGGNKPVGPSGGLIMDAEGNLFGVTDAVFGGGYWGAVFEIAKTATGYNGTPITLATFGFSNPRDISLIVDASGNLFGTTQGSQSNPGTVFEIKNSGFVTVSQIETVAAVLTEYNNNNINGPLPIKDSAENVQTNLDHLQLLASALKLSSISLTDSGIPSLTISPAQLINDAGALKLISDTYTLNETASAADVTITGAVGVANTVELGGTTSEYSIAATGNGSFTVTDIGTGRTSVDHLSNVQALQFSDHTEIIAAEPSAAGVTSGNVIELYGAVFGREPDVAGLAFYQNYAAANPSTPLLQYAKWFLASAEYEGNPAHNYAQTVAGDEQFITGCYQNLLGRTPSPAETSFYESIVIAPALAGLIAGSAAYEAADSAAHAQTLVYFSASPEFLSNVQVTAQNPASAQHWLVLI